MTKPPVTAVVITKNEEAAIDRCLRALAFCDQIVVVDSASTDRTTDIARALGAEVVDFKWNGQYPKKKQWGMEHSSVRNNWVLHVDGDEIVTEALAAEISRVVDIDLPYAAFDIPLAYHFLGRRLRFGHTVKKRSLVHRHRAHFPEVGDLDAPGITEVEGHYQPEVTGRVGRLTSRMLHDDPAPLGDWIARHNRYSDWEAYLVTHANIRRQVRQRRGAGGRFFDKMPLKPLVFFLYSYVARLGFLDGRAGYNYAIALSWYYWSIGAKANDPNSKFNQTVGDSRS